MFFSVHRTRKNSPVLIHGQTSGFDRSFSATTEPRLELPNYIENLRGLERRKPLATAWICPALNEEIPHLQMNGSETKSLSAALLLCKCRYMYFLRSRKPYRRDHTEKDHSQSLRNWIVSCIGMNCFIAYGLRKRS